MLDTDGVTCLGTRCPAGVGGLGAASGRGPECPSEMKEARETLRGQQEARVVVREGPGGRRAFGEDRGWEESGRAQRLGETE